MGHKFGECTLKIPLEEVLEITRSFWAINGGKINIQTASTNKLIYTLFIKRDIFILN